jgi:hypothetical protein
MDGSATYGKTKKLSLLGKRSGRFSKNALK